MTCASFNRAGSLVLVGAGLAQPAPAGAVETLQDCSIRTIDALNLRDQPSGSIIVRVVPAGLVGAADARWDGWYRIWYAGARGWVSGAYVESAASCG